MPACAICWHSVARWSQTSDESGRSASLRNSAVDAAARFSAWLNSRKHQDPARLNSRKHQASERLNSRSMATSITMPHTL